jgi:hypothetical protein
MTLLIWASWPAARGDSFDEAGVLLAGKYPEIEQGVALLAASGDPAAAAALQALGAGRLLIGPDKALYIESDDGALVSARDGAKVGGRRPQQSGQQPYSPRDRSGDGTLTLVVDRAAGARRKLCSMSDRRGWRRSMARWGRRQINGGCYSNRRAPFCWPRQKRRTTTTPAIELLAARGPEGKVLLSNAAATVDPVADAANAA